MLLSELINGDRLAGQPNVEICGLAADSREVRPGYLFAALVGTNTDGARYIDEAISHGAAVVLTGLETDLKRRQVPLLRDANPRQRLALMAARFYHRQPATIAAVTGTNGKSSVVSFVRQIWSANAIKAGSLGTLGIQVPGIDIYQDHTTPEPVMLHSTLADLTDIGVDHLAIEASSHGLEQHRMDGVMVNAAAFTNLSRDHFDYHATAADYLNAKLRLFDAVMPAGGVAVLNADSEVFDQVAAVCRRRSHEIMTYGTAAADLRLIDVTATAAGQRATISIFGRRCTIDVPMAGSFQVLNALCAVGLAIRCDVEVGAALEAMRRLKGVRGRLELVARHPSGAPVYVDYAHTPEALATVLRALRPHTAGRLSVVFGCGGDRDCGKRRTMGEIAHDLADRAIVTDDNPRTEDPALIRAQIMLGCSTAREVGDRAAAIGAAVEQLDDGDVLVIAGKGHERIQIVGQTARPFDDRMTARLAVQRLGGEVE